MSNLARFQKQPRPENPTIPLHSMRHHCRMIDPTNTFISIEQSAHEGAFGCNPLPTPTDAQCLAGNYKVGRTVIHGLPVAIEQPRHSYRTGIDQKTGKRWTTRLAAHYGYFSGSRGADGEPVDCFIGFYPQSEYAWVINQHVAGEFDEHKTMLCFPDEETARRAYLDSYDKGWNGLHSMVRVSIDQLKWWLKNGNHKNPLKPEHLPYEGIETMSQRITWDSTQSPEQMTLDKVLYEIRRADAGDNLVMDAVTMTDILADADEIMALDALTSPHAKLKRKMEVLQAVMDRTGGTVKTVAMQLSDPFKQNGVAQVAAVFELSDGQTISIFFHNPDVTPAKIAPTDELISWKWLLNKKDITIVVAPERGQDLNVKAVAERIIKLAEKNSAAFQRANVKRAENLAAIELLKSEIPVLEKELADAQHELEVAKIEADDKASNAAAEKKKADDAFAQQILQSLIDDYGWQNQGTVGRGLSWVTKTIGGGRTGGVVNPNGDRRVSAKVQGDKLVATWGDSALVSVDLDREAGAKANAGKLDAAVNAEDPRYVAPSASQDYTIAEVVEAMSKTSESGSVWWTVPEIDNVLRYGAKQGWLIRMSTTQVQWSDAGIAALKAEKPSDPIPELPQGDQATSQDLTEDERYERDDVLEVSDNALMKFIMEHKFETASQSFQEFLDIFKDSTRSAYDLDRYLARDFAETAFLVEQEVESYGGKVAFGNFDHTAYNSSVFDSARYSTRVQFADAETMRPVFGDKQAAFVAWKELSHGVALVAASASDRAEFGAGTFRVGKGEMKMELICKINPKSMTISFVDNDYYEQTDEVKWKEPIKLTKLLVYNQDLFSAAFGGNLFDSAALDRASPSESSVMPGSIIGEIADKSGDVVARFRVEENGMLTMYKGASGLERIADPTMAVSRINAAVAEAFGGEANKLQEPNLGKTAVSDPEPEIDQNQPHIDTLQSIVDGNSDGEDLDALLDKIDAAASALEAAGLAEQYDDLIGKAATKWAELDQKANG